MVNKKEISMSKELNDFKYFRDNQLHSINFSTGEITAKGGRWGNHLYQDVGSMNPDGYVRLWCNKQLRMKHRLIYFLYHNELPSTGEEMDHFDNVRNNNGISNLRVLTKTLNNTACANRKFGKQFAESDIHIVCKMLQDTKKSDQDIADFMKISRGTVRDIKVRRSRQSISQHYSWIHRGY